ncbi:MAG: regulatory protein RecX [Rudaea sp.]|uniref:regulatory protein RecX n=1 Tax=unclassified Rudaea TaxID=2627037 RepID=UPI0010F5D776|nr:MULTISPECIES: regulatory protein RecX [unclassified Rudaea]MBN8887996.1 regulatory protein RecX [Rudaea sp.]MBR0347146.1 regulatory protein RecX [Rudaea sp.]
MARRSQGDNRQGGAYDKALALLARREHSARELKSKLELRGLDAEESAEALKTLQSKNYQSDDRFGEMLVRSRLEGGYGARWIVAELRQHGIAEGPARALIDAAEPDWPELIRRQLRRRFGARKPADIAERNKRAAFLLRRGFETATVTMITRAEGFDDTADESD